MIISLLRKVFILSSIASFVNAGEWNQHRGPFSNNLSDESITSANWLKSISAVAWKEKTPLGFSSFTTYEGNAFTLVAEEDEDGLMREICIALDLKTGKREWSTHLGIMDYKAGGGNSGASDNKGGDGPRSTPSVLDGKVWAYDSDMSLYCLSAKNGKLIWKVNVLKEYDGINPRWENASSPLIVDDLVIIYGGGEGKSFLAFDKDSGRLKWKTGSELATHATPILTKIHGLDQVIFFCQSGLVSILPKSGKELWRQDFPFKVSTAASPVVAGDLVYCSAGYGVGAGLFRIKKNGSKFSSEQVWRKPNDVVNHWSTPVYHDGHLYGMFSFKKYGDGPLQCVELRTGRVKWSEDGYGPGNVILSGKHLIALSDKGELSIVEATPSYYKELARKKLITGKCWSTPTLSNGMVLARSTVEAVCLSVRE